ncbi:MAG TPA: hypothetical protein DIT49_06325, partial [Clostridiales bacterium]|nr:hypothetical protein [Clostridiales bacterium]
MCNLGLCYEQGEGLEQDASKAVECYLQAAQQGHPPAQTNLAVCYLHGSGVGQDFSAAR